MILGFIKLTNREINMSDEIKEATILDSLKKQLRGYIMQREQFQVNINQIAGAIFAVEQAINSIENPVVETPAAPDVPPVPEAPAEPCEPVEPIEPSEPAGE